ncbi:MAG: phosphoglycolate phosphatase [Paracoccaceae bacterium]
MSKGTIVFDLDGTLVDSAPDINVIADAVLATQGAAPLTLAQTRDFIGNGAGVFVSRMMRARDISDTPALHASLLKDFETRYRTATQHSVLYPDVVAVLTTLKDAGFKLGLCTNKPMAPTQAVLEHFEIGRFFDAVSGGDSQPQTKPDAAPLLNVFAQLGDGTRLYVGDSEVDAETAQNAAVPFALFTEGYRKTPVSELPHTYVFSSFADLPGIVASHS